ncbi:MAG: hypothetical protein QOF86_360 [Baekduia sp.]|jgi:hypothetical protein|nr:hypothetical protein [Baekduia sp.]
MSDTLELERRRGRVVGVVALLSVFTVWATVIFANSNTVRATSGPGARVDEKAFDRAKQLVDFHNGLGDQAIAAGLRCAGLLLTIVVGVYLYSMVRTRNPSVSRRLLWVAVASPVLVAAATIFGFFALRDVADAFVSSGPRSSDRARELANNSGTLKTAGAFDLLSRVAFGFWVGLASLQAMRVGLLTRFLGYWGAGAGGALVLLPVGDAMFIGWLASIGILSLGYWPGGRPPAWQSTRPLAAD